MQQLATPFTTDVPSVGHDKKKASEQYEVYALFNSVAQIVYNYAMVSD